MTKYRCASKLFLFSPSWNLISAPIYKISRCSPPIHSYLPALVRFLCIFFCLFIQSNFPLGAIVIASRCFVSNRKHNWNSCSKTNLGSKSDKEKAEDENSSQCIVINGPKSVLQLLNGRGGEEEWLRVDLRNARGGEVVQKGVEFNFYRREHFGIIKFCGVIEQLWEKFGELLQVFRWQMAWNFRFFVGDFYEWE